ncbi:UNVERIFIED_CONTAM: hypothetical protein K2H54_061356, partial [Gekko kuhli]
MASVGFLFSLWRLLLVLGHGSDYCGPERHNGSFSIITEDVPCGTTGVTCSKSIKVFLGRTELKLEDKQKVVITRDLGNHVKYWTRTIGLYLVVEASNGVMLIWDKKTTMFVKLTPNYKGKVCGLCGNFDDKANNDFTTRSQVQANNALDFGNSWKRDSKCPDVDADIEPCDQKPHRKSWAEKECSLIKSEVFAVCHPKRCKYDTCSCNANEECLCAALSSYARACAFKGVMLWGWRNDVCTLCSPSTEICEWSDWIDVSYPLYGPDSGDYETYENIRAHGIEVCTNPLNISCRAVKYPALSFQELGQKVKCDVSTGLVCENRDQVPGPVMPDSVCLNYEHSNTNHHHPRNLNWYHHLTTYHNDHLNSNTKHLFFHHFGINHRDENSGLSVLNRGAPCPEICEWSDWIDVSRPLYGPDSGDYETYENIRAHGIEVCTNPLNISCRAVKYPALSFQELGQKVKCDVSTGLVCENRDQVPGPVMPDSVCLNYEHSNTNHHHPSRNLNWYHHLTTYHNDHLNSNTKHLFFHHFGINHRDENSGLSVLNRGAPCPEICEWSDWIDVSRPLYGPDSGDYETYENIRAHGIEVCTNPLNISCRAVKYPALSFQELGQKVKCDVSTGLVCENRDQVPGPVMPDSVCLNYEHSNTNHHHPSRNLNWYHHLTTYHNDHLNSNTKHLFFHHFGINHRDENSGLSVLNRGAPCPEICEWSDWIDVSRPLYGPDSGDYETYENIRAHGIEVCTNPLNISCRAVKYPALSFQELGQKVKCDVSTGLVCENRDQVPGPVMPDSVCLNYEHSNTNHHHPSRNLNWYHHLTTYHNDHLNSNTKHLFFHHFGINHRDENSGLSVLNRGAPCPEICEWSDWIDVSRPLYGPDSGDYETYENIRAHGIEVCTNPLNISCRAVKYPALSFQELGQKVKCDVSTGLVCENRDQVPGPVMPDSVCLNYEHSNTNHHHPSRNLNWYHHLTTYHNDHLNSNTKHLFFHHFGINH